MILRLLPGAGRPITVSLLVLVLIAPLLNLAFTLASGHLVGSVPGAVTDGWDSPDGRRLVLALTVLAAAFIASYASGGAREVLAQVAGRRVDRRLRARMLDATLGPAGVAHLEDPEVLDKIAITRVTTGMTPGVAAGAITQVAVNRLAVVPPFVLLATFRWWLPLLVSSAMVWMRGVMRRHLMKSVQAKITQVGALRQSAYFVDLALRPTAAKEARIFGMRGWLEERFRMHYLEALRHVWKERGRGQRRLVLPLLATTVVTGFGYALIARAAASGQIDLARLTILVGAMGGMRMLFSIGNEDVQVEHGASVLPAVYEVEQMMAERREAMAGSQPVDGLPRHSVRFESVSFRYPGGSHDVFAGFDLEIRAGESLAIVGVNGAGKTTLVKLLARLHDPSGGRIVVDGIDLRDLQPAAWQRRVAAIFQDFTRYELSATDNVAFGALELRDDAAALAAAVEAAGAADIVDALPAGWDTVLSRRFTGGTDLSGGQWQRLALARALLAVRNGAGILVLDEPTANLDVRAEAELYDRFLDLTRGVTTVVISHRFSTVRRADRIVVIDGGRVVEDGNHESLVSAGGTYARMFHLQAARFVDVADQEPVGG